MPKQAAVDKRLTATAYHEAGHAVVAEVLGRRVKSAKVSATGGLVRTMQSPCFDLRREPSNLRERWDREREVMIYFAGLIAEETWTRRRTLAGIGSDFEAIEHILGKRCQRPAEAIAYGRWLYERTCSIVQFHWDLVTRVARALETAGRLNRAEIQKLLGKITIRKV